jgi:sec-independent protein translocase protein TatC
VSITGVIGLFRVTPGKPVGPGGQMALVDHIRELRARLLMSALVLTVALVAAFFFYTELLDIIKRPYETGVAGLNKGIVSEAVVSGVGTPLLLQLKVCGLAAVIVTCPFWLYQIWAFIVPGLHSNERRWTRLFALVAGPLFIAGVAVGYYVLPKGISVLLGFTPKGVTSLVDFADYLSFFTRMMLVFGVSFEIPVFVVLLNAAGIVSGKSLGAHRAWIIVGTFMFAAVATPSTDPFSMLMLAIPMSLLFLISEVIARTVDRRRAARREDFSDLDDDEASPIEPDADRYRPSGLSEDDD